VNTNSLLSEQAKRAIVGVFKTMHSSNLGKKLTPDKREVSSFAHAYALAAHRADPERFDELKVRDFVLETLGFDPKTQQGNR
jgi:hypothetical protein